MQRSSPSAGKVLSLPRVRTLSWSALLLEFLHQLVVALWIGALVAVASFAVPGLLDAVEDAQASARAVLNVLAQVSFLGCGAGCFLLLTTLLMHLLSIRSTRTALAQAGLIVGMTALATALQLWLAPSLAALLRDHPDLFHGRHPSPELLRFRSQLTLYLELLLVQAFLGAGQILFGVRRWYRYLAVAESGERF